MNTQVIEKQEIKNEILKYYLNLSKENLDLLIETTDKQIVGYVAVNGYSSELSKGTEIANQLINVGMNYKKAIKKDLITFENIDLSKIDVEKFDYNYIDTDKLTLSDYKQAVKDSLELALFELKQPKAKRISNDIYINKVLVFNTNTLKLSIIGKSENKVIEIKGEFKVVKSKPLTVAKKLIEKQVNGKTQALRRFTIDNLIGNIKLKGETIEIE